MGWSAAEPHNEVNSAEKETSHGIHAIGIDLGKTVFHLVAVDSSENVVARKRCSRTQLLVYTANVRVQRIGMEACSGSHFLGRALREQGHDVRLMPAQYVKPYVKTNKSDLHRRRSRGRALSSPPVACSVFAGAAISCVRVQNRKGTVGDQTGNRRLYDPHYLPRQKRQTVCPYSRYRR